MNYNSITDKPFIQTKPGESIWLCAACLERKYQNTPPAMANAWRICPCCSEAKKCQQIEKSRLVSRARVRKTESEIAMIRRAIIKRGSK